MIYPSLIISHYILKKVFSSTFRDEQAKALTVVSGCSASNVDLIELCLQDQFYPLFASVARFPCNHVGDGYYQYCELQCSSAES